MCKQFDITKAEFISGNEYGDPVGTARLHYLCHSCNEPVPVMAYIPDALPVPDGTSAKKRRRHLNHKHVEQIRAQYFSDPSIKQRDLALKYGVTQAAISRIVSGDRHPIKPSAFAAS